MKWPCGGQPAGRGVRGATAWMPACCRRAAGGRAKGGPTALGEESVLVTWGFVAAPPLGLGRMLPKPEAGGSTVDRSHLAALLGSFLLPGPRSFPGR